mgnify:CR=1 FL=1
MFIKELKFSSKLISPTEKITTGTLNIITITLPNKKFLWFIRFIEEEIEPKQDKIKEYRKRMFFKLDGLAAIRARDTILSYKNK